MRAWAVYDPHPLRDGGDVPLRLVERPSPQPGPGEVRLRVHAAAVNPTDTGLRAGLYGERPGDHDAPWIPGMDAAGDGAIQLLTETVEDCQREGSAPPGDPTALVAMI